MKRARTTTRLTCPRRRRGGFIIVATLWILIALATVASIYAVYVVNTAYAIGVTEDRPQAEAHVRAAIELVTYRLAAADAATRPSGGAFRIRLGSAAVTVDYRSEAARIDLNTASKELLAGLFVVLGAVPMQAASYADRIVAWRSPAGDDTAALNAEATLYRAAGRPYGPRQGPFPHVAELWLVQGLPPQLIERALPFLTVFGGQSGIDVDNAESTVLAALPGMNPALLSDVLRARASGVRGQALMDLLGPARTAVAGTGPLAFRVNVVVRPENGRQTQSDAVILLLENATEPYRVLSWHNDFDDTLRNGQ